ncbi:helix-turn-helix domain-containing protein [Microbacterium maritypicum]|uniref:helix-turn-helix domain-containing protein n=1 Tax=Microbacterium maritypicum TaxID=33918 RepID=UPI0037FD4A5F
MSVTSAVHGTVSPRLEHGGAGERSRRLPIGGEQVGQREQDLPARRCYRFRAAAGATHGPEISARFQIQDERIEIAGLRPQWLSVRQVAQRLRRPPSRMSRELRRTAPSRCGHRRPTPSAFDCRPGWESWVMA